MRRRVSQNRTESEKSAGCGGSGPVGEWLKSCGPAGCVSSIGRASNAGDERTGDADMDRIQLGFSVSSTLCGKVHSGVSEVESAGKGAHRCARGRKAAVNAEVQRDCRLE